MKSTMFIALASGGILAAAAMGTENDIEVGPHEAVEVPEDYGRHLIHDKFAYEAEAPEAVDGAADGADADQKSGKRGKAAKDAGDGGNGATGADPSQTA